MAANKALRRLLKRIETLKLEIDDFQNEISGLNESVHYAHSNAYENEGRANRRIKNAEYEKEQIEQTARYKEYDRQRIVRDLERARDWRDSWGVERAINKLKHL